MAKEISIFNRIEEYLKELSDKYNCGGLWIAEKMGRRISFVCGERPSGFDPPSMYIINERYLLFCEKPDRLNIEKLLEEIREDIDEK